MFAQKKTSPDIQCIEALVPRGLIASNKDLLHAQITAEGLSPLRIFFRQGVITKFEVIEDPWQSSLDLLLPRLVEPHSHLDKAFTWKESPNLDGTYEGALNANLKEHQDRTIQKVRLRAERGLNVALKNGIRAIRSHIDSFGLIGSNSWHALEELQSEWKSLIDLQLVALVPLEYWNTQNGNHLARKVANENGLLGGVISPPYKNSNLREKLFKLFSLANDYGCGVDLHIDESSLEPGGGLRQLICVLDHMKLDIPLTCSHLSSMALIAPNPLRVFAEKLAHYEVNVVALPLTNFWLLGRNKKNTSIKRPIAPINELQKAGVTVAIGGDNVQDPWFPAGNFDPLAVMAASMLITHSAPWSRMGLTTFTTGAARVMGLEWDGTFKIGSSADFVLLEADSWSSAMAKPPSRKVMINGNWI